MRPGERRTPPAHDLAPNPTERSALRTATADAWDELSAEYALARRSGPVGSAENNLLAERPERCRLAVDVGCGPGLHAALLAEAGVALVVGVDISWGMLGQARQARRSRRLANLHLVVGDAERLPLRPSCADFVVAIKSLNDTDLATSLFT